MCSTLVSRFDSVSSLGPVLGHYSFTNTHLDDTSPNLSCAEETIRLPASHIERAKVKFESCTMVRRVDFHIEDVAVS